MKFTNRTLSAIATIILGILFLIFKGEVISIAMTILGIALIVLAVMDFLNNKTTPAIVKLILGLIAIVFGWFLVSLALFVLAALMLVMAIMEIIELSKFVNQSFMVYIAPALKIVVAVCLLFNQGGTINWVFIVTGIALIAQGVLDLIQKRK